MTTGPPRGRRGELRWPPALALVLAGTLYALLPHRLLLGERWLVPALEAVLLVAIVAGNPVRLTRQTRTSRSAALALTTLVVVTNLVALARSVHELVSGGSHSGGSELAAALAIWTTGVLGFAVLYWELDRGGPVSRATLGRAELPGADWRFSQDENLHTVVEVARGSSEGSDWTPRFGDYLYLSLSGSSAFSPTDTMPLTHPAKALMGVEATAALMTSLLVVSHAVGQLGS
ncbi:hypothetical protein FHN55_17515 [Streptomyces sp. NP160]|nr:hypothetical protein FHN55_17515 [Streptomyces sp. NP160]